MSEVPKNYLSTENFTLGENTLRKWGQIKMFKDRREQKWTEVITGRPYIRNKQVKGSLCGSQTMTPD